MSSRRRMVPGACLLRPIALGNRSSSGIGKPVAEACHGPDRFASLAGIPEDAPASPEAIAAVLNQEALADLYLVNQADMSNPADVRCLCDLIRWEAFPVSLAAP